MDLIIFSSCLWRYQYHWFDNSKLGCIPVQEKCSWSRRHMVKCERSWEVWMAPKIGSSSSTNSSVAHYDSSVAHYDSSVAHYHSLVAHCHSSAAHYNSSEVYYHSSVANFESSVAYYDSSVAYFESSVTNYDSSVANFIRRFQLCWRIFNSERTTLANIAA